MTGGKLPLRLEARFSARSGDDLPNELGSAADGADYDLIAEVTGQPVERLALAA